MIIFDTETTGLLKPEIANLDAQPHIIEVAMVRLDEVNYEEVERFETLLDPGVPIDEELHKKITGLTNADLAGKPTFFEVYRQLADFCLGEWSIVAHNYPFDRGMLEVELRRINAVCAFPWPPNGICTVERTMHIKSRRMRLSELYELKLGKPLAQTHRAMGDALALAEVVREMRLK